MDFPVSVFTPELPHVDSASIFITFEILTAENGSLCSGNNVLMRSHLADLRTAFL